MILVLTGSSAYPFNRLLEKCEAVAPSFNEPFVLQTGLFDFPSKNCRVVRMTNYKKLMEYYEKAKVAICHASSGPLIYTVKYELPAIVIPRRKHLGEAWADHQLRTVKALITAKEPMRQFLFEVEELEAAIRFALEHQVGKLKYTTGKSQITTLHDAVREACT